MTSASGHDKPPTKGDLSMSKRHAADSYKFNMRHAKDHLKAAKKAKSRLTKVNGIRYKS